MGTCAPSGWSLSGSVGAVCTANQWELQILAVPGSTAHAWAPRLSKQLVHHPGCLLQNADSTDIYTISRNWADLVKRARAKQLQPQEYNSLTFTLSNLGMFGADTFDAILPPGTPPSKPV